MKRMKRVSLLWLMLMLAFVLLVGCGTQTDKSTTEYTIYDVDRDENKVLSHTVEIRSKDTKEVLQILFQQLKKDPEKGNERSAIPNGVSINHYNLASNRLTLDFSKEYLDQTTYGEVLTRAAIVRTLCQMDEIDIVYFTVDGNPLLNKSGKQIGFMDADDFVDNDGSEINNYEKATLTLYFATADGASLKPYVIERVYNTNISLDKLVMEELIKGPGETPSIETRYPTLSSETNLVNVTTLDGVCYVNFGSDFMAKESNVTPEVVVYSIVNSLVELPDINKVQISIDGNSDINLMETISLATSFERNLEIIDDAH